MRTHRIDYDAMLADMERDARERKCWKWISLGLASIGCAVAAEWGFAELTWVPRVFSIFAAFCFLEALHTDPQRCAGLRHVNWPVALFWGSVAALYVWGASCLFGGE